MTLVIGVFFCSALFLAGFDSPTPCHLFSYPGRGKLPPKAATLIPHKRRECTYQFPMETGCALRGFDHGKALAGSMENGARVGLWSLWKAKV